MKANTSLWRLAPRARHTRLGDDRPLVRMAPNWLRCPGRREQLVFPQQLQYAVLRGSDALMPKPGPNLAIALAAEHRLMQQLANGSDQFGVGEHLGAPLLL